MKQPAVIMKIVMAVLLAGVLLYFGVYLVRSYQGGITTVLAYADTVNVGMEATGVLVREEHTLAHASAAGLVADLHPDEGEKVAAGEIVATLYASASGLDISQDIRALEAEIEQLEYVLAAAGGPTDAARLDSQVVEAVAGLRSAAAAGDLSGLEDSALRLRTLVFTRDYIYGQATTGDLTALIADKNAQLTAQRSALGAASTRVYAPTAGVFSGVADGLEASLTPAVLDWVSPSQLRDLQRAPAPSAGAVGKLITSATWYFAAILPEEEAASLHEEGRYTLVFSLDWSGEVEAVLERLSDPENGEVAAIFSCRTHLSDTTQLRGQTVEIVTSTLSGLRIPRQALRSLTETVTNDDGTTTTENVLGVYVLVGKTAEFKEVSVLWQDGDTFLVNPVVGGSTDRAEAERFQAGDEVIVSTAGLYDGKVIR